MIIDFLAEYPILRNSKLLNDITNEVIEVNIVNEEQGQQLFYNSTTRRTAAGVGLARINPHKHVILKGILTESCTNSTAKCNELIVSFQIAQQLGVKHLEAYKDSKLIINQMT